MNWSCDPASRRHSPGLPQLDEPGRDVARHDDQRVLQLPVSFGRQLAVDELAGGDDLLTHGVLEQRNITVNITEKNKNRTCRESSK